MRARTLVLLSLAASLAVLVPGSGPAGAQEQHVIRIATLAPRGTPLVDLFQDWDREIRARTSGRVRFRIFAGGTAGDESAIVRKMRQNQLDAAALTTTGLGAIARPILVLAAPGLIPDYPELDRVRTTMAPELEGIFDHAGYKLLAWGDAGRIRLFSQRRIARPEDMRAARPWVWRDNPIMVEFVRTIGANGVPLGVPEVYPALQTGQVDTVLASALAAVGFQWFIRLRHVSSQHSGILVGALVIKRDRLDALPPEARDYLVSSAADAGSNARLRQGGRDLDDRAYRALLKRGLTPVDSAPHRAAWERVQRETRERLAGRLYPRDLLQRVERAAAAAGQP